MAPAAPSAAASAASPAAADVAPVVRVPPPPVPPPAALDRVTYGIVSANPMHWVALIAQAKKLMEPYGIDFDLVQTRTTPAAMSALAGGSVDLATTSPGGSWDVQQKTPGFKQVMEIVSTNPYTVLVQPEIASYEDLRGKTVAGQSLQSGADIEMLRLMLDEHGLQYPRDYDILAIGSIPERAAALLANQVSAGAMIPPNTFELLDQGRKPLDEGWRHPPCATSRRSTCSRERPGTGRRAGRRPPLRRRPTSPSPAGSTTRATGTRRSASWPSRRRWTPATPSAPTSSSWSRCGSCPANPRTDPKHLEQAYCNLKNLGQSGPTTPRR